ncbi:hypothetical protein ACFLXQ_02945 [Chloroflexota bacterium]
MSLAKSRISKPVVIKLLKFSCVPILLFLLSIFLSALKEPYHLGQSLDPEYIYLFNSLNLLHLVAPDYTDHPGTTLQMLGALIILLKYGITTLFRNTLSLQYEVLMHHTSYLRAINLALNGLIAVFSFLAGLKIYQLKKSWLLVIIFQLSPYMFKALLETTTRMWPETLLVLTILWLSIILIPPFANKESHIFTLKRSLLIGAILGFGIATKITFLPLILLVLLPNDLKKKAYALASCIISFLVFTFPIWPQYGRVAGWLTSIAIHDGRYGQGTVGIPDLDVLRSSFRALILGEPAFFAFIGLILILLVLFFFNRKIITKLMPQKNYLKVIVLFVSILILQTVITVKHPSIHYLVPSMSLVGIIIFTLFNILELIFRSKAREQNIMFKLRTFLIIFVTFYILLTGLDLAIWIQRYRTDVIRIQNLINVSYRNCTVINYYHSSSPQYALSFGNDHSNRRFGEVLSELYPNSIFYNIWSRQFYGYVNHMELNELKDRLDNGECLLMRGTPFAYHIAHDVSPPPVILERLDGDSLEALYRVQAIINENVTDIR